MPASRTRSNIVLVSLVLLTVLAGIYMLSGRPRPGVTYLALGDSYTIGTGGQYRSNYANQTVQLLRQRNIDIADPVVIARGGWTTSMLARGIKKKHIKDTFTFVSLFIGTNNQYNHLGIDNYRREFEELLKTAITYTNGHAERVIVMSLPDWSTTAFAANANRQQIAEELSAYNIACKEITDRYQCRHLDITPLSREIADEPEYFAPDGLHPSPSGHALWAERLASVMGSAIQQKITKY